MSLEDLERLAELQEDKVRECARTFTSGVGSAAVHISLVERA